MRKANMKKTLYAGILVVVLLASYGTVCISARHTEDIYGVIYHPGGTGDISGPICGSTPELDPQLSFQFANAQVINGPIDVFSFDIQIKCDQTGTYLRENKIDFAYNTQAFGPNIGANQKITVEKIGILAEDPTNLLSPLYSITSQGDVWGFDYRYKIMTNTNYPTAYGGQQLFQGGQYYPYNREVPTTWVDFLHIEIEISILNNQVAGIYFVETPMNGYQFYTGPSSSTSLPYRNPNHYENDLTGFLLGTVTLPQLTWRFANVEIIHEPMGSYLQFDIEVKCNQPGTFHEDLNLEFYYNTAAFGQQIVYNGKITVEKLELLQGEVFGQPKYNLYGPVDGTSDSFGFSTESTFPFGNYVYMNAIETQFKGFVQIRIEIMDATQQAGLYISDAYGYYQTASGSYSYSYFWPSLFENDLLTQPLNMYDIAIKVVLEGPFAGSSMQPHLNMMGFLPLQQPYSGSPWFYSGTEAVPSIPNQDIVDWVLVELRDAPTAAQATSATTIARQAAFLTSDGNIVDLDGTSKVSFSVDITSNLFAVILHRNHLAVLSAQPLPFSYMLNAFTYDFTTAYSQTYNGLIGCKEVSPGVFGMIAGDGDASGRVNNIDKLDVWTPQCGASGYYSGDFDLNGQVNHQDKLDKWAPNAGHSSQVPS